MSWFDAVSIAKALQRSQESSSVLGNHLVKKPEKYNH